MICDDVGRRGRALGRRPLGGRARHPLRAPRAGGSRDRGVFCAETRNYVTTRTKGTTSDERNSTLAADLDLVLLASGLVAAGCGGDDDTTGGGGTDTSASTAATSRRSATGTLHDRHRRAVSAVRDRDAERRRLQRLRRRPRQRHRRPARADARVPGHLVRHDLPRHGRRASSTSRSRPRRSRRAARRRSTSPTRTTRPSRRWSSRRAPTSPRSTTSAGKIVGAQDATTGETYANDETDASEVRGFPEGPDAIAAVTTGQVDAAIIDEPVAVDAVEKSQGGSRSRPRSRPTSSTGSRSRRRTRSCSTRSTGALRR